MLFGAVIATADSGWWCKWFAPSGIIAFTATEVLCGFMAHNPVSFLVVVRCKRMVDVGDHTTVRVVANASLFVRHQFYVGYFRHV